MPPRTKRLLLTLLALLALSGAIFSLSDPLPGPPAPATSPQPATPVVPCSEQELASNEARQKVSDELGGLRAKWRACGQKRLKAAREGGPDPVFPAGTEFCTAPYVDAFMDQEESLEAKLAKLPLANCGHWGTQGRATGSTTRGREP